MAIETILIKDLDRNGLQTRVSLDESTVAEYAEAMKNRAKFPPVKVFCDGEKFYLADGFHRVEACLRAGYKRVKADTDAGSYADALRYALRANAAHGLRRSNADKRRCLEMAWERRRELFGENDPTAELLAETCGISRRSVVAFYTDVQQSTGCANCTPCTPKRIGVDGKVYTVPTPKNAPETAETGDFGEPAPKTGATRPGPPTRRPVRDGYYIAEDGKEHATGVRLDRFFREIPPEINAAFFEGTATVNEWAARVHAVKLEIQKARGSGFPVALAQRVELELENACHELKAALPHCVCRVCKGNGCDACGRTGYQTKDQYDRNPREFKDPKDRT